MMRLECNIKAAETWALRRIDETRIEGLEMRIWRKMEGIKCDEKIRNVEVFGRVEEEYERR